jgi:polysaccharide biosynthesis transport protein
MRTPEIAIHQIVTFIRLRWRFLLIPPILVTILSGIGAFMLPREYESSIRILTQRTEVPNPLSNLANALTQSDDTHLSSLDDIIYSERTYRQMIDSLGFAPMAKTEAESRALMARIRSGITTRMTGGQSFGISYQDRDPYLAQRGAAALANIFIWTVTDAKNQRSQLTVEFYEKKLDEFRQRMDESQNQIMARIKKQNGGNSGLNASLYSRLDQIGSKIKEVESDLKGFNRLLATVQGLPPVLSTQEARGMLFEIQRYDATYTSDLRPLLTRYDVALERYTSQHPEVMKVENRIREVVDRISSGAKSDVSRKSSELEDLRKSKASLINELMASAGGQKSDDGLESNYLLYQRLYTEMMVKLEEAQITKSLGSSLQSQYIVMDPAYLPLAPSKPSRMRIVLGGFGLGIFLGLVSALIAEFLDTTIRGARSVEVYGKPVIAFLPERKDLLKELK